MSRPNGLASGTDPTNGLAARTQGRLHGPVGGQRGGHNQFYDLVATNSKKYTDLKGKYDLGKDFYDRGKKFLDEDTRDGAVCKAIWDGAIYILKKAFGGAAKRYSPILAYYEPHFKVLEISINAFSKTENTVEVFKKAVTLATVFAKEADRLAGKNRTKRIDMWNKIEGLLDPWRRHTVYLTSCSGGPISPAEADFLRQWIPRLLDQLSLFLQRLHRNNDAFYEKWAALCHDQALIEELMVKYQTKLGELMAGSTPEKIGGYAIAIGREWREYGDKPIEEAERDPLGVVKASFIRATQELNETQWMEQYYAEPDLLLRTTTGATSDARQLKSIGVDVCRLQ